MEHHTVILAAGDFPKKGGAAWKLLAAAKRVVACDSAADAYRRRFRKWPTVIIGDLDSFSRPNLFPDLCSLIPNFRLSYYPLRPFGRFGILRANSFTERE